MTMIYGPLFGVFTALSLLHLYWALGGSWGFEAALPTDESGKRRLNPSKWASAGVALALAAFGLFYLLRSPWLDLSFPAWLELIAFWGIPLLFLLRAIGDFRYVGFFKRIKHTRFARLDTYFYSPLCATIALLGLLLLGMN